MLNRFNLGGPTYNAAYLTKHLGDDFETVLVGGAKDDSELSSTFILDSIGVEAEVLPSMRRELGLWGDARAWWQLVKMIKKHRPVIVHTHASKAGFLGRAAAIWCRVPVVVHTFHGHVFHSYFGLVKTAAIKSVERLLARLSTVIIAISAEQKRELTVVHAIAPPDKVQVVKLGFDLDRFVNNQDEKRRIFRNRFGLSDDDVVITILGRLVPVKNHRMFIEAAKLLVDRAQYRVRFLIVGDGELRAELESYARSLGFQLEQMPSGSAPLHFTGWIREADEVCAGSDVLCLTSHNEGTPVSLIEAQAAAKPVVSVRVGGIEDVVAAGRSALLSERGDVLALVSNLEALLHDAPLRRAMGEAGRAEALKKFSYQRLVGEMRQIYLTELKRKGLV